MIAGDSRTPTRSSPPRRRRPAGAILEGTRFQSGSAWIETHRVFANRATPSAPPGHGMSLLVCRVAAQPSSTRRLPAIPTLRPSTTSFVFRPSGIGGFRRLPSATKLRKSNAPAMWHSLTPVTSMAASAETQALGVKCCVSSPEEAEFVVTSAMRRIPGVKMIVVVRRDLVAQYASLLRARRGGAWHSWRDADRPPVAHVHIRPVLFDRYVTNALDTLARLRCEPAAHIVVFEELVGRRAEGCERYSTFSNCPMSRSIGSLAIRSALPRKPISTTTSR